MSAPVLVLVEHDGGAVKDPTLPTVTAAARLGPVHALVAGDGEPARQAAQAAARIAGVEKVWLAASPEYAHDLAELVAPLAVQLMVDYEAFLAPATTMGKNVAPRVAALLDVMQISEIVRIDGPRTFTRPIYAGNALATVESSDPKLVITVRGTAFDRAALEGGSGVVEEVAGAGPAGLSAFVSLETSKSERPDLTSARIVVAGGRALKDPATFDQLIVPLADKLGAAIGASRAAVDAGYISNDYQVGQTGKIVAPELYIAIGISGAIQHLAGMKESQVIVAINKDPDAPIFQIADVGLVADIFQAVPELTAKL
jgi:electron transfer flavoprotein alpha subunit